jgi:hypothetical protein
MGGDAPAPTTAESTQQMLQAYTAGLPGLTSAQVAAAQQYEPAMQALREQISPREQALNLALLERFGPAYAQANANTQGQNQLAQARNDLAVMTGAGRDLVTANREAQMLADPEAYAARQIAVESIRRHQQGLVDPNAGLSGAERAEIDRSLARSAARGGTLATPNNAGVISDAMAFGQAGEARRQSRLGEIAQNASMAAGAVQPLSSRVDAFQLTTGRPSIANTGFASSGAREVGQDSNAMGMNLLNNTAQIRMQENQINANRRDSLDRVSQVMSSLPSVSCCWIFYQYYKNVDIPIESRISRDLHMSDADRAGYQYMASWLIPYIKTSKFVYWLIYLTMIMPLNAHANWYVNRKGFGWLFEPVKLIWFTLWQYYGERLGASPKACSWLFANLR